jgi:uncharacterized membrane protein
VTAALALVVGIVSGLRSMTPPAVVAWAAHFGWLRLGTPARTGSGPFGARIVSGGFAGAALAVGLGSPLALGAIAGGLGGVAGTLGGYRARTGLVRVLRVPDFPVALLEDIVAVGTALLVVAAGG